MKIKILHTISEKKGLTLRFVWFLPFFNIAFCLIVKNSGFGSKNLGIDGKNLGCAPATATNLIKRMKTLNIVKPVVGAGKGKYVLMCHSVERNDALFLYLVLSKQIILPTSAKCLCH